MSNKASQTNKVKGQTLEEAFKAGAKIDTITVLPPADPQSPAAPHS